MSGYEMPTSWAEASDEFKARAVLRAQAIWAKLKGPGDVPERLCFGLALEKPEAFAETEAAAREARAKLAAGVRLIEEATGHEVVRDGRAMFVSEGACFTELRFISNRFQERSLVEAGHTSIEGFRAYLDRKDAEWGRGGPLDAALAAVERDINAVRETTRNERLEAALAKVAFLRAPKSKR